MKQKRKRSGGVGHGWSVSHPLVRAEAYSLQLMLRVRAWCLFKVATIH
jgi:hypothetical protein